MLEPRVQPLRPAHAVALPDGIHLRLIQSADMDFMRALYASTRAQEMARVPWPDQAKREFLDQQFALQHHHYQTYFAQAEFLLILRQALPIGRYYIDRSSSEFSLIDIALVDEERGHGIGTALLTDLVASAEHAQRSIELHVEPDNPARRLYARFGFVLVENRGVYDLMRRTPNCNALS